MTCRAIDGDDLAAMHVATECFVDGGFVPGNVGWDPERGLSAGHNFLVLVKSERIINCAARRRGVMFLLKAGQDEKPDSKGDYDNS
jgi:hypothetical protein